MSAKKAKKAAKKQKVKPVGPVITESQWPAEEQKHETGTPGHDDSAVIHKITLLTIITLQTPITLITQTTLLTLNCQMLDELAPGTQDTDYTHVDGSGDEEKEEVGNVCVACDQGGASKFTCKTCKGPAHEGCSVPANDPDDECSVLCHVCSKAFSRGVGGNHDADDEVKDACVECGEAEAGCHKCRGCHGKVHGELMGCSVQVYDPDNEMAALCTTCKVAADDKESPVGATCCVCKKRGKGPLYRCFQCEKAVHSGIQGCSVSCHETRSIYCNNCKSVLD